MKKLLSLFLFFLCGPLLAAGEGPLIVLTSADNPPYEFIKDGQIVGFEVDLCRLIGQKLGREVHFRDMPFSSLIPALKSGRGDLAVATLTETPDRRQQIAFSIPLEEEIPSVLVAVARANDTLPEEVVDLASFFDGKTVGVQLGSHHEENLKSLALPQLTLRSYETVPMMLAELKGRKNLQGIVLGEPEGRAIVASQSGLVLRRLPLTGTMAIGLRKNSPLLPDIDRILEEIRSNGGLKILRNRWLGEN